MMNRAYTVVIVLRMLSSSCCGLIRMGGWGHRRPQLALLISHVVMLIGIGLRVVLMRDCIALRKAPAVEHRGTMIVISSE